MAPGTYWWQVKTAGGGVETDNGVWRSLTVVAAPTLAKTAPPTGTTGLGSPVTLQWGAVANEGYWVCWDTTPNQACDTGWQANGAATTRGLTALAVGTYYWQVKTTGSGVEADGGTWWSFTVTVPSVPANHWKAEYFGNVTLSGPPVATVDEGTGFVDHSWGTGGPAGLSDFFSTRFTRTVTLAAGRYRFTQTTDDGSRLWVDDQLQIDAWGVDGLTTHTVDLDLAAGDHTLRFQSVEYTGGATAQLTWGLRTPVVLASGESLGENQTRVSLDGAYRLQYQGDGNLVVVRLADDSCAWSSQTNNTSVGATVMQGDGNLVIYNGDWTGIWSTGTWGHDGARLEIANDELAVVAPDATKLWWVSLATEPAPRPSAAGTAPGSAPRVPAGTAPGAAGVLLFVVALLGVAARAVWRRGFGVERRAAGGAPHAARPVLARLSATALLLTAMLLLPARALAQTPTQVVEYYHTDALGSVRAVTKQVNGQWQVVARHDFMPFGEEVAAPIPPQDKRLFTGKERDAETKMDYFGARYYRANLGCFSTVDPELNVKEALVEPQRWNRYAYVTNNPLRYTDPDGKNPLLIAGGIGATVYGGWAIYQNISSGAPHWYNNVGVEATKGLVVGLTLGLAAPAVAGAGVAAELGGAGAAGTVWGAIRATQPVWEGTVVPRSFELGTSAGKVWVHGNATEHLAEYATSMLAKGVSSELVKVATQAQLSSLQSAVTQVLAAGMKYNQMIQIAGWELKFGAPSRAGQLPALIHAMPLQ